MMSRRSVLALLVATMAAYALPTFAQSSRRIPLSQLEDMFANMRAKTKWNVDGPLLWGYFFVDPSAEKLKQVAAELTVTGFRVVEIRQVSGKPSFQLHVERIEALTATSLHARNIEFYSLADKYSLASYDGMDVGPAPTASK